VSTTDIAPQRHFARLLVAATRGTDDRARLAHRFAMRSTNAPAGGSRHQAENGGRPAGHPGMNVPVSKKVATIKSICSQGRVNS
jgi:hypothetical protein